MNDIKPCSQCKIEKSLEEFGPDRRRPGGLQSECRQCHCVQAKAWYEANQEAIRARRRTALEVDPSRRATAVAGSRQWRKINRARAIEIYGGRCVQCGSTDRIEFDHMNGDGAEHREIEHATAMHRKIVQAGRPLDDWDLQLLCFDHHRGKTRAERWGT